eukprot:354746-Chlamydomonas_euryale.AAC.2
MLLASTPSSPADLWQPARKAGHSQRTSASLPGCAQIGCAESGLCTNRLCRKRAVQKAGCAQTGCAQNTMESALLCCCAGSGLKNAPKAPLLAATSKTLPELRPLQRSAVPVRSRCRCPLRPRQTIRPSCAFPQASGPYQPPFPHHLPPLPPGVPHPTLDGFSAESFIAFISCLRSAATSCCASLFCASSDCVHCMAVGGTDRGRGALAAADGPCARLFCASSD